MTSETFAHAIGRLEADPLLRLALAADPWLALACYDQIRGSEPWRASLGPTDVAGGPGWDAGRARHDRAA